MERVPNSGSLHFFGRSAQRAIGTAFLLVGFAAATTFAQQLAPADLSPSAFTQEEVSGYDMSRLGGPWWHAMGRAVNQELIGTDRQQEQALQKIIFFGTYYPTQVHFGRSVNHVYHIYRFHRDERLRMMAIAAMTAIGSDEGMRLLAYRDEGFGVAHWDSSSRVQGLVIAAVNQHFSTPAVQIGRPVPAS